MKHDCKKCGSSGTVYKFDQTPQRIVTRCEKCHFTINMYRGQKKAVPVQRAEREVIEL